MNESDYYQKVPNLLSSKPVPLGLLVLSENPWDKVNLDNSKVMEISAQPPQERNMVSEIEEKKEERGIPSILFL